MIAYLISKTFFDLWDHLLWVILLSLAVMVVTALAGWMFFSAYLPLMLVGVGFFSLGTQIFSGIFFGIIDDTRKTLLKKVVMAGLGLGLLHFVIVALGCFAAWFYFNQPSLFNMAMGFLVCWLMLVWLAGAQLVIPLYTSGGLGLGKSFRVSFLLFLQNPLLLLVTYLVGVVLAASTATILPGLGGQLFFLKTVRDILRRKYEWLEAQPVPNRKAPIPWQSILKEEMVSIGGKSLRGLFKPWR